MDNNRHEMFSMDPPRLEYQPATKQSPYIKSENAEELHRVLGLKPANYI